MARSLFSKFFVCAISTLLLLGANFGVVRATTTEATTTSGVVEDFEDSSFVPSEIIQDLRILYQGELFDTDGNILPDGKYNVKFGIYDQPEEGQRLWNEEHTFYRAVSVSGGEFKTIIGRDSPITLNAADGPFWFGITVGVLSDTDDTVIWDEEMSPRKRIILLSDLFNEDKEISAEDLERIAELIKEKFGENADIVLLFDAEKLQELLGQNEVETSGGLFGYFKEIIGFISQKLSEISESLNNIFSQLANITNLLADMKQKIDALFTTLVLKQEYVPPQEAAPEQELVEENLGDVSPVSTSTGTTSTLPQMPKSGYVQQEIGKAIIPVNAVSIRMFTPVITQDSLIFVSFVDDPQVYWWISQKESRASFTISLKAPAFQDLRFSYWIFNPVEGANGEPEPVFESPEEEIEVPESEVPPVEPEEEEKESELPVEEPVEEPEPVNDETGEGAASEQAVETPEEDVSETEAMTGTEEMSEEVAEETVEQGESGEEGQAVN